MKSLMIVEPSAAGHRLQHVRRLIAAATEHNTSVTVVTKASTVAHPAFMNLKQEHAGAFHTMILPESKLVKSFIGSKNLMLNQLGYYLMYRSFFAGIPTLPDHVFVPYLEQIDHVTSMLDSPFRDTSWSGLVMKCAFHHRETGVIRPSRKTDLIKKISFLNLITKSNLHCMFTFDPTLCEYPPVAESRIPVIYLRDPHDTHGTGTRLEVRANLGIPEDTTVILVYGDLTASAPRKGLDQLLIAASIDTFPRNTVILIAGSQGPVAAELLSTPNAMALKASGRLLNRNWYHTPQEEFEMFSAADIVWVGYRNFYWMSGILIQAGAMKLPVISCDCGVIGWMTQKYNLGPVVDVDDPVMIASAVRSLQDPVVATAYTASGYQLSLQHTSRNFCDTIYGVI